MSKSTDFSNLVAEIMQPRIAFGVTKAEMEQIQEKAAERGLTVEQYAYEAVMEATRK